MSETDVAATVPEDLAKQAMSAMVRAQASEAAEAQLDSLRRTIASTRTRDGRIKRAKFVAAVLALRMQDFGLKETAELLGCSQHMVSAALMQVRKDATIPEQLDRLDKLAVSLAVDNVLKGIIAGDKEYTLRLMDGRGLFRQHKSVQAEVRETILQLQVVVEQPRGSSIVTPRTVGSASTAGLPPATTLSTLTGAVGSIEASMHAMEPKE